MQVRLYSVIPAIPEPLGGLRGLAYNLWWCWHPDAVDLFRRLDPSLWTRTHQNPIELLAQISQDRLRRVAGDVAVQAHLERVLAGLRAYLSARTWFQVTYPQHADDTIAYFSMEYGLHQCLPVYSGGLGVLAGDHLKSASDLGVPLVGVGLMYHQGYFQQRLSTDGWQFEDYPDLAFRRLPALEVRAPDGSPLRIAVELGDHTVHAGVWQVKVGRISLYLLDTKLPENSHADQEITARLYGGDVEMRIRQEIVLGFGGVRALAAIGIRPSVFHMNEGHSAFLGLERTRELVASGLSFAEAREAVAASTVFTTHTPVPAGIDTFTSTLMHKYLDPHVRALGLSWDEFLSLGRQPGAAKDDPFSMAVLALSLTRYCNGVSKVHGEVARELWHTVWPQVPREEVPITSITNGVHIRTWLSNDMARLFERYLGPEWADNPVDSTIWARIDEIPDAELWRTHERLRERLVAAARQYVKAQLTRRGAPPAQREQADEILDPEALTIGFARRFAPYKRGTLILRDPERLTALLTQPGRPVQLIVSGKAHPRDNTGKELIKRVVQFARHKEVANRIVFIEDYDIGVAHDLVQGVDIWLNNPIKRLEASGTSGMKVTPNGGINVSVLDGWWPEAYDGTNGWAIGDDRSYDNDEYQDFIESEALYDLLEREIVPLFYERASDGLPRGWIARMKNSMRTCSPKFSANRMLREYTEGLYVRGAAAWKRLRADQFAAARALTEWKARLGSRWGGVQIESFGRLTPDGAVMNGDATVSELEVGESLDVAARVRLGEVSPDEVAVELYYGPAESGADIRAGRSIPMKPQNRLDHGVYEYIGSAPCASSGLQGFAVRVIPKHPDLIGRYDLPLIRWG